MISRGKLLVSLTTKNPNNDEAKKLFLPNQSSVSECENCIVAEECDNNLNEPVIMEFENLESIPILQRDVDCEGIGAPQLLASDSVIIEISNFASNCNDCGKELLFDVLHVCQTVHSSVGSDNHDIITVDNKTSCIDVTDKIDQETPEAIDNVVIDTDSADVTNRANTSANLNIEEHSEINYETRAQGKKRNKQPITTQWKQNESKRLRSEGESYMGYRRSQKVVYHDTPREARQLGSPCTSVECVRRNKRQCSEITENQRQNIFSVFWKQTSWDQRKTFVVNHVELKPKQKTYTENTSRRKNTLKYFLTIEGEKLEVCKKLFLSTTGLGEFTVHSWLKKDENVAAGMSNSLQFNNKTRKRPINDEQSNKIDFARKFLNDLPKLESHYGRKSSTKVYLEPLIRTMHQLYNLYCEFCKSQGKDVVSRCTLTNIFNEMNLSIHQIKKDKCDTCVRHEVGQVSDEEWQLHVAQKDRARLEKEHDKEKSIKNECKVFTMDLQAVKVSPWVQASAIFYKTKLCCHNFTVYDLSSREVCCFWFDETAADQTASTFATCILEYLQLYCKNFEGPIILYSDGCTYQNRNSILSNALLSFAVDNNKEILQKFLVSGHTQMECDSVHSRIENALKGQDVYLPQDYIRATTAARKIPFPYLARKMVFSDFKNFTEKKYQRYTSIRPGKGQSESKKKSKGLGPETKGTAMSFGFKKKFQSSKKMLGSESKEKYGPKNDNDVLNKITDFDCDNGNSGSVESIHDRSTCRTTSPRLPAPRKEIAGGPLRSNRFGFRQTNIVRPISAGIIPKVSDLDNIANNNTPRKPRSKSATTSDRTSITLNNAQNLLPTAQSKLKNPKITDDLISTTVNTNYQEDYAQDQTDQERVKNHSKKYVAFNMRDDYNEQTNTIGNSRNDYKSVGNDRNCDRYTVINTGIYTNEIVRPTPTAPSSVSKFTLHTASLPKPQYPVPISLSSSSATTQCYAMDAKFAKQAANNSRREFYRDISCDSGIASGIDMGYRQSSVSPPPHQPSILKTKSETASPRRTRGRSRHLEMVMSSRHKFDVRDLNDSDASSSSIAPLSLPKLPIDGISVQLKPAPITGLVRHVDQNDFTDNKNDYEVKRFDKIKDNKISFVSLSDVESIEEEKLLKDNSISEKNSIQSPPISSRTSWCMAGECMAIKDDCCSSVSVSSISDTERYKYGVQSLIIDTSYPNVPMSLTESSTGLLDDSRFAEITAASDNDCLLDDETSPTNSLLSSSESDEVVSKKNKKKINDSIKWKKQDDRREMDPAQNRLSLVELETMIDLTSPLSPETPTHASNSQSLSDGAKDFLIDDEIADQPALCFGDQNSSNHQHHSSADTPTLIDSASHRSKHSVHQINFDGSKIMNNSLYAPQVKPRHSLLSRTDSMDTLSPCESIASDDMMMDFDCHSSMDSIDIMTPKSNHSGSLSTLPYAIEEINTRECNSIMREFDDIKSISNSRQTYGREQVISQLPARATRLLNRSRIHQNGNSENIHRKLISRPIQQFFPRHIDRHSPAPPCFPDDNAPILLDKSLRNTMIQDVLMFKKQLVRLRSILQENEEYLMKADTLNPFDLANGQFFSSGGYDCKSFLDSINDSDSISSYLCDDPKVELADLRRQVVYLQTQLDDKDRTIRLQKNHINQLELDRQRSPERSDLNCNEIDIQTVEMCNSATQTDRTRPLSFISDNSSRNIKYLDKLLNETSINGQQTECFIKMNSNFNNYMKQSDNIFDLLHAYSKEINGT